MKKKNTPKCEDVIGVRLPNSLVDDLKIMASSGEYGSNPSEVTRNLLTEWFIVNKSFMDLIRKSVLRKEVMYFGKNKTTD